MYARTTIERFYSYIESGAFRVGQDIVEVERDRLFLNNTEYKVDDLPLTFGSEFPVTIGTHEEPEDRRLFVVNLGRGAIITFIFVKRFLFMQVTGDANDFSDSVGLLGDFSTSAMYGRDGSAMSDFTDFAFEWQVGPKDPKLFREARSPQLPAEKCRMPTQAAPSRRRSLLRADKALLEKATAACAASGQVNKNFDLCVDDILQTGEVGLAYAW